jgi:hypothetical protein
MSKCDHKWINSKITLLSYPGQLLRYCSECRKHERFPMDGSGQWLDYGYLSKYDMEQMEKRRKKKHE